MSNEFVNIESSNALIKAFENNENGWKVRSMLIDGKPYFGASDIAKCLKYKNPRDAVINYCKGVVTRYVGVETGTKRDGSPAIQQMEINFIPIGDVGRLINGAANQSQSNIVREKAQQFESWLYDDVFTSIMLTGSYSLKDKVPQTFLEALELAVEKEKQRLALEQKCLEEKARADEYQSTHELYEAVTNKGGWISAKTVTDVLNILGLGRTNFYRFLREQGVVTGKNQPMRCHIETGLMKARYDDYLKQYCVEFSFKGLKYIYAKLVQANKVPSDLTLETWIKYCADLETNHGDSEE